MVQEHPRRSQVSRWRYPHSIQFADQEVIAPSSADDIQAHPSSQGGFYRRCSDATGWRLQPVVAHPD